MSAIKILTRRLREYAEIYAANERMIQDYPMLGQLLIQAADTIESLCKKQSANKWIPCSERLPEEKINPVTNDFYEYQVTFRSDEVTDIRHYKFGRGHWRNCGQNMDKYVTAWREPLEAYHEQMDKI